MKKIILILFTMLMCYQHTRAQESPSHKKMPLGVANYVSTQNIKFTNDTLNYSLFHKQFGKKIYIEGMGTIFLTERDAEILFNYYKERSDSITFRSYLWLRDAREKIAHEQLKDAEKNIQVGKGIELAGVLLYSSSHIFWKIPTFTNDNGLGFFDPMNPYYNQNVEQRKLRTQLRWMRGIGAGLILFGEWKRRKGYKGMKNAELNISSDGLQIKYNLNK